MMREILGLATSAAVAGAILALAAWLWPRVLPPRITGGERGERRQKALEKSLVFRIAEPVVRALARRMEAVPLARFRAETEKSLAAAGRPFGFDANELWAASALSAAAGALSFALLAGAMVGGAGAGFAAGLVFGAALPWLKVDEHGRRRRIAICRGLPQAIDLVALAMEAGLDFPGALAEATRQLPVGGLLRFELGHLMHKLALGWSRADAIAELATRVPAAPVRLFASAVIQAEQRGNPLAAVLAIQADVMRLKRSQAAEEAASRAAVLILGPLMLIFACVFVLLLGPFVVKFLRGELF